MDKKKAIRNILIITIITGGVLFWVLKDDFAGTIAILRNINVPLFLLAMGVYGASFLLTTGVLLSWLRINHPKFKFVDSLKSNVLASFARGVTPFASGGQAMQVYTLGKFGVNVEQSLFVLSIDFLIYQIAAVAFILLFIILRLGYYANNSFIFWGVITGTVISSGILVLLFLLVRWKKLHHFLGNQGVNLLVKIRVIKDAQKARETLDDKINDFSKQLTYLPSQKRRVVQNIVLNLLGLLLTHSLPFIVALAIGADISFGQYIDFVAISVFVGTFNAMIPVPGGTGGTEPVFMLLYGIFIAPQSIRGMLIGWRFITFYFMTIVGAIYFVIFNSRHSSQEKVD